MLWFIRLEPEGDQTPTTNNAADRKLSEDIIKKIVTSIKPADEEIRIHKVSSVRFGGVRVETADLSSSDKFLQHTAADQ